MLSESKTGVNPVCPKLFEVMLMICWMIKLIHLRITIQIGCFERCEDSDLTFEYKIEFNDSVMTVFYRGLN